MSNKLIAIIFLGILTLSSDVSAVALDGMAAAVDEEIILESDVTEEMHSAAREMGQLLPSDPKELRNIRAQTLQMLIDRKVLLAKAEEEKIVVSDDDVAGELSQTMANLEKAYGSREAMEQYLAEQGATYRSLENSIKRRLKEKDRIKKLVDKMIGSKVRITEDEIVEYYNKNRDQLELPELISISEVVIAKKPSESTERLVYERIEVLRRKAETGMSFEDLVRRESEGDDVAGGGLLELTRGAIEDKEYEKAVFALKTAEISKPLRTTQGFELVKMVEMRGDTAKIRHLVLLVRPSEADIATVRARAVLVRDRLRTGEEFAKVAAEMSDDEAAKATGGKVEEIELARLERVLPGLATGIKNLKEGELSDIIEDVNAFFIVRLDRRAQGRELTLDEARNYIESYLKNIQIEKQTVPWLNQLRARYYIRVF